MGFNILKTLKTYFSNKNTSIPKNVEQILSGASSTKIGDAMLENTKYEKVGDEFVKEEVQDEDIQINGFNLVSSHAYMVNSYDKETDTVLISNPWGDNRRSSKDDIRIPLSDFKNNFLISYLAKVQI